MNLSQWVRTVLRGGGEADSVPSAVGTPWRAAKWIPLGQDRLALGSSGWEIQFVPISARPPYLLIDPEAREMAVSHELEALKILGERMLAERRAFRGNR